ncbi:GatB/YqeY domain-containing protein [Streptomonospora alba]|uniref:GatB/YqeY domain-containing protein n=1 Tax=Streptomonospora alba TaxID=183763 RepID=UPI00187DA33A|nr:GatB/YqeY domain-containing protein [Streptomonospora alba]
MRTHLRRDLTAALKNRDKVAASALRSALAAIENAESSGVDSAVPADGGEHVAGAAVGVGAAEAERRVLTESDVHAVVAREVSERSASAQEYVRLGREDAADRLRAEADVLSRYLNAEA